MVWSPEELEFIEYDYLSIDETDTIGTSGTGSLLPTDADSDTNVERSGDLTLARLRRAPSDGLRSWPGDPAR